ncbi:MAG: glycosyltransferase family 4 protein [Candidatus Dojkabacteria bacterium]|nr:glycosyltransferase family 4 protein [Candidatus Dojkabacteria bacterium]
MAKIIQVSTFFHPVHGGVEQQALELSLELIKQGHEVEVICSDSTRSKDRVEQKEEEYKGIKITRCKTWFSLSQFYKFFPKLFFELMKRKFDIVHVHGFRKYEVYAALLAAKLKRKRIVVTTHNPFVTTTRGVFLQLWVNIHDLTFGKMFTRFLNKIICLTSQEIPFVEKFGARPEKIVVIPNGVPDDIFKEGKPKEFVEKYDIPSEEFENTVVWLGRLHPVKGLENLQTAVSQLKNTLFLLMGPDDIGAEDIKNLYKDKTNVFFTGPIDHKEVPNAMKSGDVFVYPSAHEAFGLTLVEAMAQGLPCIVTNKGGPGEIVNDTFGIVQDPEDEWAWMLNIKKLIKDRKLRQVMGSAAKEAAKKYLWENVVEQILDSYEL